MFLNLASFLVLIYLSVVSFFLEILSSSLHKCFWCWFWLWSCLRGCGFCRHLHFKGHDKITECNAQRHLPPLAQRHTSPLPWRLLLSRLCSLFCLFLWVVLVLLLWSSPWGWMVSGSLHDTNAPGAHFDWSSFKGMWKSNPWMTFNAV